MAARVNQKSLKADQEPVYRGDIFIADLDDGFGTRPALVIQNNMGNYYSDTIIVVPITSKKKKPMPTHVWIPTLSGIKVAGTALCEHIFTIRKYRLKKYIGTVRHIPKTIEKIEAALAASILTP